MKKFFGVFTLICILALTGAAFAATPQAGKPVQDKPEKTVDRVTTVSVSLEGTDSIGARLGTKLKERFNQSSLFTLNDDEEKDIPKLYVMASRNSSLPGYSTMVGIVPPRSLIKSAKSLSHMELPRLPTRNCARLSRSS